MFWFNDQQPDNHRRRRGWSYGFPWLIFCFIWLAPHFWWAFFGFAFAIFLIMMAARYSSSQSWLQNQQPPYQSNQPNQPNQPNQYYTPPPEQRAPQQPYYESYQQGYHAEERPVNEQPYAAGKRYGSMPEQSQDDLYQDYDQPKAEYPQQLPPM